MSDSSQPRLPGRLFLPAWAAAVLDAALITLFAVIGRASHSEANPVFASLSVAWPFLVGAAVGWIIALTTFGRHPTTLTMGVPVWISAVAVGMALRALTGQGTAFSFIVVATVVLAAFLLGWRALAVLWRRRRNA